MPSASRKKPATKRPAAAKPLQVLVLSGPNLNLLGTREPGIYGNLTLKDIVAGLTRQGRELGVRISHFQSNHEGALVDRIQQAGPKVDGILFNPAAYTHTSVAIRDALLAVKTPFVEVHLSDPETREKFRHFSYFTDIAVCQVKGLGPRSYEVGLEKLAAHLRGR